MPAPGGPKSASSRTASQWPSCSQHSWGMLALIDARAARADMWPWLATVYTVLGVAGAVLPWLFKAVPVGWLVAAIWEGRDRTPGAGWLVRPSRDDADSWVDERMISQALAHLGLSPLDRFFKAGGELVYTVPARVDGEGTYAQVRLPMGATADMVAAKRTTLAANLGRATLETWPTQGEEAGILELGSRRANSVAVPDPGRCCTRARWMCSRGCRSARPSAGS